MVVATEQNQIKDDDDITECLPPNQGAYCEFAAVKVYVKSKWKLTMNEAEHAEIERILTTDDCNGQVAVPAVALANAETAGDNGDILPQAIDWWMIVAGAVILLALLGFMPKSAARAVPR